MVLCCVNIVFHIQFCHLCFLPVAEVLLSINQEIYQLLDISR